MSFIIDVAGAVALLFPAALLIYVGWRNQRAAKDSPLVDDTNFGARLAAIVEVVLHPDRAATWHKQIGTSGLWVPVFPELGQDSSEAAGIREDDGRVT